MNFKNRNQVLKLLLFGKYNKIISGESIKQFVLFTLRHSFFASWTLQHSSPPVSYAIAYHISAVRSCVYDSHSLLFLQTEERRLSTSVP